MIAERPGGEAAALRQHLPTGGQRIEQFGRWRWADVGDQPVTIFIPLLPSARSDLAALKRAGEYAISTTAGKKIISVRSFAGWAHAVVADSNEGFQLKRMQSGVETLLAAYGVSREVRGDRQSHCLTGVQAGTMPGMTTCLRSAWRSKCFSASHLSVESTTPLPNAQPQCSFYRGSCRRWRNPARD